jgi:hypothetical protein
LFRNTLNLWSPKTTFSTHLTMLLHQLVRGWNSFG